jgi:tetratricopeptide (TPR) repeat protein
VGYGLKNNRKVISFHPNGEYYFHKGLKAYQTKDLHRSKKYLQRAVRFEPDEPDFLCQLAAVLADLEEYEASNDLLGKVVSEIEPDLAECHFYRANNFVHLGLFEEAEVEIQRYIALDPDGEFFDEAEELLELLEEEIPYPTQDHDRARYMLKDGQYEQALEFLLNVVDKQPDYWEAHNYLALTYFYLNRYKKALTTLEHILKQQPGHLHALCNLAVFYRQLDNEQHCDTVIEVLKGIYPFFPEERAKLGSTLMLLGEYKDAYRWLKSAEKAGSPVGGPFHYWLAVSAYFNGNVAEAERAWKRIGSFDFTKHHPFQYSAVQEMLLEEKRDENPLIQSLLTQVLKGDDDSAKCFALFVFREICGEQTLDTLKKIVSSQFESPLLKKIASNIVLELDAGGSEKPGDAYRIFTAFQRNSNHGRLFVEDYTLYWHWFRFAEKTTSHRANEFHNINAWTAALDYSLRKKRSKTLTQKEVAKKHGISPSTLSSYKRKMKRFLLEK